MKRLSVFSDVDPAAPIYGKGKPAHLLAIHSLTDGTIGEKYAVKSDDVMSWLESSAFRGSIWDLRLLY